MEDKAFEGKQKARLLILQILMNMISLLYNIYRKVSKIQVEIMLYNTMNRGDLRRLYNVTILLIHQNTSSMLAKMNIPSP
ncbi:MAG: hypothetical protein SVZ03_04350 [Spirochaetota bacterium]|nr:hypothetical protein [Spirochaetota bacterium]